MHTSDTVKKAAISIVAIGLLLIGAVFFSCKDDDSDDESWLFYATYNDDGTFGSSGLTQSEWEKKLSSVSNGSELVLAAELSSDDLATFVKALIASGKTGIKLDLSNLSITSIPEGMFSNCTAITSIVLPETITSIGKNAFSGCTSLTSITIGSSLTSVNEDAFSGCTSLKLVTYSGTSEDWENISIASGNDCLTEAEIVCSGDMINGTVTATLDGDGEELGTVSVTISSGAITSVSVGSTECTAQTDGTFTYTTDDYTYAISVSGTKSDYTYTYEITDGTVTASLDGDGKELGTVSVTVSSSEITAVSVGDAECSPQDDGTFSYSDDDYTYAISVSGSNGVYTYTYEITDGTVTASLDGEGEGLGTVSVTISSGAIASVTVDSTNCTAQTDGTFTYITDDSTYAISVSGSNGVYTYTYDAASGTFTATYSGSGIELLGDVTVAVTDGAITSVSVDGTACETQDDDTFTYTGSDYTYAIAISGSNGVYTYTYQITGGTFEAPLDGEGTELGTVTVVVTDGAITAVSVGDTSCTAQDDDTFSYSDDDYTYVISVSGSNGIYTYTYEITGGTFTATYSGSEEELGTVSVTVSSGEITAVSVDGSDCTAQDDGTFSYSDDDYTYAISVSGSNGIYTYTYEITGGTFTATYSGSEEELGTVSVTVSSGEVTAVSVKGTECTAQDDGTFSYTSGINIYTITVSGSIGSSYSYSYEVSEGDYFGTSSTTYLEFVSLLSDLSDGCTIVLYPGLTTAQFECFVTALMNSSLSNVTLDMSYVTAITEIGDETFSGCTNLTSVILPSCVETIGDKAFYECTNLTSITIAEGTTTIGSYAFYKCTNLTTVTIGSSVTTIGDYAFAYCSRLTEVTIPDSVTSIGDYAFYYCIRLTSVTIGSNVTTIGSNAFSRCSALTEVKIPDSVTSLGKSAFYRCTALKTAVIGDGVATIPTYAFDNCTSLTTVTIGSNVTTISNYAFNSCSSIETVVYNGTKSDWESISTYSNTYLTNATIICTDGVYGF